MAGAARILPVILTVVIPLSCICPFASRSSPTPVASPTIAPEAPKEVTISTATTDSTGQTVVAEPSGTELAIVDVRDADSEEPIAGIDVYLLEKGSRYLVVAVDPEGGYLASWREGFIDELGAGTSSKDALGSFILPRAAHAQALPVVLILLKVVSTVSSVEDLAAYLQDPPDFEYWGVLYEERCWTGEQLANYVGAAGLVIPGGEMEYFMEAIYLMSQHVIEQDLKEYLGTLERPVRIRTYHLGIPFLGMVPVGWCDEELTPTRPSDTATPTPMQPSPQDTPGANGISWDLLAWLQVRLTPGDLSPDGRWIAFDDEADYVSHERGIFLLPVDGSEETRVGSRSGWDPSWSPDGQWIAFQGVVGYNAAEIFIMRPDGSGETQLTSYAGDGYAHNLSWSPDGQWIAFAFLSDPALEWGIFVVPLDGSGQRQVTFADPGEPYPPQDTKPCWSPDGQWIAFLRDTIPFINSIFIIRPHGSDETEVVSYESALGYDDPVWSPDGQWIAFSKSVGSGLEWDTYISIIRPDGSDETLITSGYEPSWSRDGQWIAFHRASGELEDYRVDILAIRPDGSDETLITSYTGSVDLNNPK